MHAQSNIQSQLWAWGRKGEKHPYHPHSKPSVQSAVGVRIKHWSLQPPMFALYSHQRACKNWPSIFPTILICEEWAIIIIPPSRKDILESLHLSVHVSRKADLVWLIFVYPFEFFRSGWAVFMICFMQPWIFLISFMACLLLAYWLRLLLNILFDHMA